MCLGQRNKHVRDETQRTNVKPFILLALLAPFHPLLPHPGHDSSHGRILWIAVNQLAWSRAELIDNTTHAKLLAFLHPVWNFAAKDSVASSTEIFTAFFRNVGHRNETNDVVLCLAQTHREERYRTSKLDRLDGNFSGANCGTVGKFEVYGNGVGLVVFRVDFG